MNGHCCQSRWSRLKWPALLALALMFSRAVEQPLLAETTAAENSRSESVQMGPVRLTVAIDRGEVRVADPFQLTVTARAPRGVRIQFPELAGRLGDFLVTRTDDAFDVPDGDSRTWTRALRLESLISGRRDLPPVTLTWTDSRTMAPGELSGTISTPSTPITIVSEVEANADPTRFRDIKGVVSFVEPIEQSSGWVAWALAGLGVLALAGLAMLVVRRRSLTAEQWALRELDLLEQSGFAEAGRFDQVICRVTDILRLYIERRFRIRAPQHSTPEFLAVAETFAEFDNSDRHLLGAILEFSDYVKFARFDVASNDAGRAIQHARRFVEQTAATVAEQQPKQTTDSPRSSLLASA